MPVTELGAEGMSANKMDKIPPDWSQLRWSQGGPAKSKHVDNKNKVLRNCLKENNPGVEKTRNGSTREGIVVSQEQSRMHQGSAYSPAAPGLAQRLGRSGHSAWCRDEWALCIRGQAVPVIEERVSDGKIMNFLFKKWGFKRIYSVIWSISLCGTNP